MNCMYFNADSLLNKRNELKVMMGSKPFGDRSDRGGANKHFGDRSDRGGANKL